MTVEERLREARVPGEREAAARAWAVVRAGAAERGPGEAAALRAVGEAASPRELGGAASRRRRIGFVAGGAAAVALAAALTPAGASISRLVDRAVSPPRAHRAVAARSVLPAGGRVLVAAPGATWVLGGHGARRAFPGLRDPAWSPHGRFVAGVRNGALTVLTPAGRTVWALPGKNPRDPRWAPDGRYIAYESGGTLRFVWGNGTHDAVMRGGAGAAVWAWRPGVADSPQTFAPELSYVTADGILVLRHMFTGAVLWQRRVGRGVRSLAWSASGGWLVAAGRATKLLRGDGWIVGGYGPARAVAFAPRSTRFVLATRRELLLSRATSPSGIGTIASSAHPFDAPAFSPDGRWVLAAAGDTWLLARTAEGPPEVRPIRPPGGPSARPAGWCCAG